MILQATVKLRKAGVAILISDKANIKIKKIMRDKEGQYITIKGNFQQEDIMLINTYAPNIGAPKNIKQLLTTQKEILIITQ